MALTLHNLKPRPGSKKKRKKVGRGNASGHGTYSTRGLKGQRSRSGGRSGLKFKGLRRMLASTPQKRGFKSIYSKMVIVNIGDLEKKFNEGEKVTPKILLAKGLIKDTKNGVKVLGQGELSKKLAVQADAFSKSAEDAINKVGGSVKTTFNKE